MKLCLHRRQFLYDVLTLALWRDNNDNNITYRRWYHQSQIKNGILFIDGGIESFSDRSYYHYVCFILQRLIL